MRADSREKATLVWFALAGAALAAAVLAGGFGAGCSHASKPTAPGCCEKSGPGWTDDAGADGAAPVASVPAKPPARFRLEEGCARDFKWSGEGSRDLGELERLCAQGLAPILGAAETSRSNGAETVDVPFQVTGSTACLRAAALGVAPGQIVSIENTRGAVLARAAAVEALAVVPVDGTVCVREPGTYRLVIKAPSGGSEARTLTVQVWQASRD
ncbi:MAG: hypothetical protein ABW133_06005 [Polyangiaceae bacterium]